MKTDAPRPAPPPSALIPPHVPQPKPPGTGQNMEEIAMVFSQHVERSSKALHQRRIQLPKLEQALPQISAPEHLRPWCEQLSHLDASTVAQRLLAVQQLAERCTPVDRIVHLADGDPAQAHILLERLTEQAEANARKTEALRLRACLARLHKAHGAEITAGLNIGGALLAGLDDPTLRQSVLRLYYDKIVLKQSLVELLQQLLELFLEEHFETGLKVLRRALADDIASETPSRPSVRLRKLLAGLESAGQLSSLIHACRAVLARCPESVPYTPVTLSRRVVGLPLSGVNAFEAERLSKELNGGEHANQQQTLSTVYGLMRSLPLSLWSDLNHRQRSLAAIQTLFEDRSRI